MAIYCLSKLMMYVLSDFLVQVQTMSPQTLEPNQVQPTFSNLPCEKTTIFASKATHNCVLFCGQSHLLRISVSTKPTKYVHPTSNMTSYVLCKCKWKDGSFICFVYFLFFFLNFFLYVLQIQVVTIKHCRDNIEFDIQCFCHKFK